MDNTFRERELSINWRLRLELYVKDSIRKLSGQKTSSELIAAALEKGVNTKKLDELIEDMEAFTRELENRSKD